MKKPARGKRAAREVADALTRGAQDKGAQISGILEALRAPNHRVRMARWQVMALRQELDALERELARCEQAGVESPEIVSRVARTWRTVTGSAESQVRAAAYLAECLDLCAHLAAGYKPVVAITSDIVAKLDPEARATLQGLSEQAKPIEARGLRALAARDLFFETLRVAVRAHGVGDAALARFAVFYPEAAVKIDRKSLDRLVIAWTAKVQGGRWPVLAEVWRACTGVWLAPVSIKNEIAKLERVMSESQDARIDEG